MIQITAKVKACEIREDGTVLKLIPLNSELSAEGKGSILIPGGVYAEPGSLIDIEITISTPLQLVLFHVPEHVAG